METEVKQMDAAWAELLENLWRRFESLVEEDRQTLQEATQQFDESGTVSLQQQARLKFAEAS